MHGPYNDSYIDYSHLHIYQAPDPRPPIIYSRLQFLDLVLIRSQQSVGGFGVDARIASAIRCGSLGMQLPDVTVLHQWDRVGLIQLPSFIDAHEYSAENIEVTEATLNGVQTRTLRQVLESSMEVVIRPMYLGSQIARRQKEAAERRRRRRRRKEGQQSPSEDEHISVDTDTVDESDDASERVEYLQKYYQFIGPLMNRPYGTLMDKLEPTFRWVMAALKKFDTQPAQVTQMDALLERHVAEFTGTNGRVTRAIPFKALLPIFREMANESILNTFSDAEIFELVNSFMSLGDSSSSAHDRVSLSNNGYISKYDFLQHWKGSLERTMPLRRMPREVLSDAFVSQALQHMGILPAVVVQTQMTGREGNSEADPNHMNNQMYFLPMDFAMKEPPAPDDEEEWLDANDGERRRQKKVTEEELFKEHQARKAAQSAESSSMSHLPHLAPSPPLPSALRAAAITPATSPSHASISMHHESIEDEIMREYEREGVAILHIHAYGKAKIGLEYAIPIPPSLNDKEQDYEIGKIKQ